MGSGPETTGISRNEWVRTDGPLFPTILNAVHAQRPEAKIAALFEWNDFGRLFESSDATLLKNKAQCKERRNSDASDSANVAAAAADAIRADKPALTIVHLDLVDHAGHANDYGTPEYLKAVNEADGLLGVIVAAVHDAGIADKTVVIAVSDHGGINKKHGGPTPEERMAAWIAAGPGIVKGKAIETPVTLTQTSPTIARLLGVKAPSEWTAKPIEEIFATK
jgi:bisphosphoglycerate-independent phosphoglycerate mutase (AlkP superfamily)